MQNMQFKSIFKICKRICKRICKICKQYAGFDDNACNMQNMQKNMHDMQNMQTSFPICRICTAQFADVRVHPWGRDWAAVALETQEGPGYHDRTNVTVTVSCPITMSDAPPVSPEHWQPLPSPRAVLTDARALAVSSTVLFWGRTDSEGSSKFQARVTVLKYFLNSADDKDSS